MVWTIQGLGAGESSGNFTSTPEITLDPSSGNYDYTVKAGIELDGNIDYTRTIDVHVYGVQMQFGGTAATDDDAVLLSTPAQGSNIPANQPWIEGQARLIGSPPPQGLSIDLSSNDGTLAFGDYAGPGGSSGPTSPSMPQSSSMRLDVDHSGQWTPFSIFGLRVSLGEFKSDVVAVTVAGNGLAGGIVVGDKGMTVFWFKNSLLTITKVNPYVALQPGALHSLPGKQGNLVQAAVLATKVTPAVKMEAQTQIDFALLGPLPQIRAINVGIVQIELTSHRQAVYGNPVAISLRAVVPPNAPKQITLNTNVKPNLVDAVDEKNNLHMPIYDPARGASAATGQVAKMTTYDTPSATYPVTLGRTIAGVAVRYTLQSISMNDTFADYEVLYTTKANGGYSILAALRSSGWSNNINSNAAPQFSTPDADVAGGSPATDMLILFTHDTPNGEAVEPQYTTASDGGLVPPLE